MTAYAQIREVISQHDKDWHSLTRVGLSFATSSMLQSGGCISFVLLHHLDRGGEVFRVKVKYSS